MGTGFSRQSGLFPSRSISRRDVLRCFAALAAGTAGMLLIQGEALALPQNSAGNSATEDVTTQTVQFPSGGENLAGYLAKPSRSGRHPGVLLIHDEAGLTEGVQNLARRFAASGFLTFAPDLFSPAGGSMSKPREQVAQMRQRINPVRSVADTRSAYDFLSRQADADPQKLSGVGLGWGGWRIYMLAEQVPLYRAVVFCGTAPNEGWEKIKTPVLAQFAQRDFVTTGNAVLTQQRLGSKFTYYVYPNAERTFFYPGAPGYDAQAADLAWKRTLEFLNPERRNPAGRGACRRAF